mgnify:CR=1 FL=1
MRLLSVCLAALVLAACSSSEGGGDDGPTAGQIPDKAGMTVKGIVKDSAGNGIAGVVVSDGLEVTATDERGIYYLASDLARRNFVFVSVPAGLSAVLPQNRPQTGRQPGRFYADTTQDSVRPPFADRYGRHSAGCR